MHHLLDDVTSQTISKNYSKLPHTLEKLSLTMEQLPLAMEELSLTLELLPTLELPSTLGNVEWGVSQTYLLNISRFRITVIAFCIKMITTEVNEHTIGCMGQIHVAP